MNGPLDNAAALLRAGFVLKHTTEPLYTSYLTTYQLFNNVHSTGQTAPFYVRYIRNCYKTANFPLQNWIQLSLQSSNYPELILHDYDTHNSKYSCIEEAGNK